MEMAKPEDEVEEAEAKPDFKGGQMS